MKGEVPKCPTCTGVVKPDIVFFGEELPRHFLKYLTDFPLADLLIIMGTSLEVSATCWLFSSCFLLKGTSATLNLQAARFFPLVEFCFFGRQKHFYKCLYSIHWQQATTCRSQSVTLGVIFHRSSRSFSPANGYS